MADEGARCAKCQQPVVWASTRYGRRPFDVVPVTMGRSVPQGSDLVRAPSYTRRVEMVQVYSLHWETCARKDEHQGRAARVAGNDDDN